MLRSTSIPVTLPAPPIRGLAANGEGTAKKREGVGRPELRLQFFRELILLVFPQFPRVEPERAVVVDGHPRVAFEERRGIGGVRAPDLVQRRVVFRDPARARDSRGDVDRSVGADLDTVEAVGDRRFDRLVDRAPVGPVQIEDVDAWGRRHEQLAVVARGRAVDRDVRPVGERPVFGARVRDQLVAGDVGGAGGERRRGPIEVEAHDLVGFMRVLAVPAGDVDQALRFEDRNVLDQQAFVFDRERGFDDRVVIDAESGGGREAHHRGRGRDDQDNKADPACLRGSLRAFHPCLPSRSPWRVLFLFFGLRFCTHLPCFFTLPLGHFFGGGDEGKGSVEAAGGVVNVWSEPLVVPY